MILAVIAAIGYGTINQAVKSHEILKEQQAQLLGLQNAVRVLEQDFVQAAPRPVRQPIGDEPPQVAFIGAPPGDAAGGGAHARRLVQSGRPAAPGPAARGLLSRERARCGASTGTCSTRRSPARPCKHDLLEHVKSRARCATSTSTTTGSTQWPPSTSCPTCTSQEQALRQRPLAVEITLDTEDWGKIVRIIEIAG